MQSRYLTSRLAVLVLAVVAIAACDRVASPTAPAHIKTPVKASGTVVSHNDILGYVGQSAPECLPPWTSCRDLTAEELGQMDQLYYELWDGGCYDAAMSLYQQAHTGRINVGTSYQNQWGARTAGTLIIVGTDTTLSDVFTTISYQSMSSWTEVGRRHTTHEMIHADHFFDGDYRGIDDLGYTAEELDTQEQTMDCGFIGG